MTIPPRDLVQAAYEVLLGREPDPEGFKSWIDMLDNGMNVHQFLSHFISAEESLRRFTDLGQANRREGRGPFIIEHSQYGEVEMLILQMVNSSSICRTVVDVGARGIDRSNSYDLLKRCGWRGILIEAHPELCEKLKLDFGKFNVNVIHAAVSDYNGEADFFIGTNLDVSSLSETAAAGWGQVQGTFRVPVRRLPDILAEQKVPEKFDLLSLDIEGEDIKVLNDLIDNTEYRPKWIIIEASYNFSVKALDDISVSENVRQKYEIVGQTQANLILTNTE